MKSRLGLFYPLFSTFLLIVGFGYSPAWASATLDIHLSLRQAGPTPPPVKATLALQRDSSTNSPHDAIDAIQVAVEAPGDIRVPVPGHGVWRLNLSAEGFWSEEVIVHVPSSPDAVSLALALFPAGEIRGKVETSDQKTIGGEIEVAFADIKGYLLEKDTPHGKARCPVSDESFRCSIPAGELDVDFSVRGGYAKVYLWDLQLEAGAVKDLGSLKFVAGGAVVGWVVDDKGQPQGGAEVRGELALASPAKDMISMHRLDRLSYETKTNRRGFFQLNGLASGTYSVVASYQGYAPASTTEPILIRSDLTVEISQPLELHSYATLALRIEPSSDPFGEPWQVRVVHADRKKQNPPSDPAVPFVGGSRWERPDIPPGSYYLLISASDDSRWLVEKIELDAGQEERTVLLSLLEVKGVVTMGDDPVPGVLWLECGQESRIRFVVNEDGEFSGFLLRGGSCRFDLQPSETDVVLGLNTVEVQKKEGENFAYLEIKLPNTHLEGEVVDGKGRFVPGATISIVSGPTLGSQNTRIDRKPPLPKSRVTADAQGTFEVKGLLPGSLIINAEKDEATSDFQKIELEEDKDLAPLRLVLQDLVELSGWVYSNQTPVAGAFIVAWRDISNVTPGGNIRQVTSDIDGSFLFEMEAGVHAIDLIVQAPGYATRILKETVDATRPLAIELESRGGDLILQLASDRQSMALLHQQTFIPLNLLRMLAAGHESDRMEIPNIAAGEYVLCAGRDAFQALMGGNYPPEGGCTGGFLPSGGELVLFAPGMEAKPKESIPTSSN